MLNLEFLLGSARTKNAEMAKKVSRLGGDTLWPRAGGGPSRLVTRGARLAHPRFFPLRRLRQLGGFLAQGAPGGHTAYRRRTPALPLKEDCQIVNRQWFVACGVKEVEEREGGPVQGHSPPAAAAATRC